MAKRVIKKGKKYVDPLEDLSFVESETPKEIEAKETDSDSRNFDVVPDTKRDELEQELAALNTDFASEPERPVRRRKKQVEQTPQPVTQEQPKKKIVIPGRLVVKVTDKVFTRAITTLDALISKKDAIDPGLLSIEDDQLEDLIPLAEEMVAALKLEEHPIAFFFGSMGAIYLTNFMMVKSLLKKQEQNGKPT